MPWKYEYTPSLQRHENTIVCACVSMKRDRLRTGLALAAGRRRRSHALQFATGYFCLFPNSAAASMYLENTQAILASPSHQQHVAEP